MELPLITDWKTRLSIDECIYQLINELGTQWLTHI